MIYHFLFKQTKFKLSMCYGYLEIHVQKDIIKNYFF